MLWRKIKSAGARRSCVRVRGCARAECTCVCLHRVVRESLIEQTALGGCPKEVRKSEPCVCMCVVLGKAFQGKAQKWDSAGVEEQQRGQCTEISMRQASSSEKCQGTDHSGLQGL